MYLLTPLTSVNLFFICYTLTRRSSALIKFQPLRQKLLLLIFLPSKSLDRFRAFGSLRQISGKVGKFIGCDYETIAANVVVKCSVE